MKLFAFSKALLILARQLRRIADSHEKLVKLYELDLRHHDPPILLYDPKLKDEVEVSYGPQFPNPHQANLEALRVQGQHYTNGSTENDFADDDFADHDFTEDRL